MTSPTTAGQGAVSKPRFRLHCRMPSTATVYGNVMTPDDRQWRISGPCIETHWHLYPANAIKKVQYHLRQQERLARLAATPRVAP